MENNNRVKLEIQDSDIATVEALHDLLLDNHGYSLAFDTLKKARDLTVKMHKIIGDKKNQSKESKKISNHPNEDWMFDEIEVDMYCKKCDEPKNY